ncbi:MAG: hypothetical protein ACRD7E_29570 [Bryobacteraceae bacterium]
MAARQSAPVIGALCSRADHSGVRQAPRRQPWAITVGYRFQPSSRHFVGTVEQKQREAAGNQIQNTYHLLDFSISRDLTPRWSLTASLPLLFAYRDQLYPPRGEYRVSGIGDMTAGVRGWVFRPPTESGGNIGIGVSLKAPTGVYNATGKALDRDGNEIVATADQSIQAGDGGTGFTVDIQAYKPTVFRSMVYFSGSYLFNPRNTNGVSTFRSRRGEEVMSVSDQYLFRGGISHAVPKVRGLTVTFGGRMEGVPVRDAIGGSDGFRRPGYAISIDPGFMYATGSYVFSCNIPFAVERNRRRSVTDIANGTHGDAAFADYALTFGFSKRF